MNWEVHVLFFYFVFSWNTAFDQPQEGKELTSALWKQADYTLFLRGHVMRVYKLTQGRFRTQYIAY